MENEILDDNLIAREENSAHSNLVNWTSLICLWIGIVFSALFGVISEPTTIAGVIALVLVSAISYYSMEIGAKVSIVVIIAGVLKLLTFFPLSLELNFDIFELSFDVDLILLFVLFLHFITNKEYLTKYYKNLYYRNNSESEFHDQNHSKIAGFKRRFSNKSAAQLAIIIQNEKLVPEARKAAKELYDKKSDIN